jgi:hypothetical protein
VALFDAMTPQKTFAVTRHKAILSMLLFAVIFSGIPRVVVHSHHDADFGHTHDADEHHDNRVQSEHGGETLEDVDRTNDSGPLHAHNIAAPALPLIPEFDVGLIALRQSEERPPPPTANPPDNVIPPLYRPPIA